MYFDESLLTEVDIHLFNEGRHFRLYEKLGAHPMKTETFSGTSFALWAPNAESVSVIGDFNGWDKSRHLLRSRGQSGIWEGTIPGVEKGAQYKYHIASKYHGYRVDKTDPFAFYNEISPSTASIVWDTGYDWGDGAWMEDRQNRNHLEAPWTIYEIHIGSWMRVPEEGNRPLSYHEMGPKLAEYVKEMGFTHVEFLPVMEHPFYGSWGYQSVGYFAPTSRYGDPQAFMSLIDCLHQHGIGVILDWVPSHFPNDEHGLAFFDGTHLFEHADPQQGFHPEWKSCIFNYERKEVCDFILSSALFWLDKYHADGIRVDAVASMLYLDYGRNRGEWVPNKYGGKENLGAIDFLRRFNEEVYRNYPQVQTIAEESTSWSMVSRPTASGGLGFGMKWDMGWMHDTLAYMSQDPVHRKFHHNKLTFRLLYAFHENFVLPLSHDEVVYGKGSLLHKMPGDLWQKFANLRALFGYMYAQPGKKLIFMGGEFGQWNEWYHEKGLDWHLLDDGLHSGLRSWVKNLNDLYRRKGVLHELDFDPAGFSWLSCDDATASTLSMLRRGRSAEELMVIILNLTPVPRFDYRIGVPGDGFWEEVLNSDAQEYGGSGMGNYGGIEAEPFSAQGQPFSLKLTLPPLAAVFFSRSQNDRK